MYTSTHKNTSTDMDTCIDANTRHTHWQTHAHTHTHTLPLPDVRASEGERNCGALSTPGYLLALLPELSQCPWDLK